VHVADDDERGSARGHRRGAGKCKKLTTTSGEVQGADDAGRGSANTMGKEVGERRNASERGGVGPPEQPAQLPWLHATQRARPDYLARRWVPDPTTSPKQLVYRGVKRVYKGESGRSANRRSWLRTTT
jgi:hypothetical protein